MGDAATEQQAAKVLSAMKRASETVRSAIAASIPVAQNQVLTVSLPGHIIDWKEYYYNVSRHVKPPLDIQIKEARLVDGMIPLSKFTAGKTGKSVARSYLAALDFLVPVEASVSGVISNDTTPVTNASLKAIQQRYKYSMGFLTSPDDTSSGKGKSKVDTYVEKQSAWATEVALYTQAQSDALKNFKPPQNATVEEIKKAREDYMDWIQKNARKYKNNIQTKYMDWVVHGYKFMVDFHFGVVDISSGMKRIENSKEAYRNLTIIAADGSSEYNGVVLSPASWATIVAKKVVAWGTKNNKPNPAEIRAELRRLQNLLASHEVLSKAVEDGTFYPVLSKDGQGADQAVEAAYAQVYTSMDDKNATDFQGGKAPEADRKKFLEKFGPVDTSTIDAMENLSKTEKEARENSLKRSNKGVRELTENSKSMASKWLVARITQLKTDIDLLKAQLTEAQKTSATAVPLLPVVNTDGIVVTGDQLSMDPSFKATAQVPKVIDLDNEETWRNNAGGNEPDPWTKISCKVAAKSDEQTTSTSQSASSVAAKAGWGLFSASGGASHSKSSAEAMASMSSLEVEVSMSCMVVEIERPWLHGELFSDAELDSGEFQISPGEEALKKAYDEEKNLDGKYQQFSSYPTAFVVASDIELSFSGDTSKLESAVSASSTSANLSVGYGPFAVSGSHSSSKSKSRTKMESTATGCRISVEAPQIIGWVQTLLPELPKRRDAPSAMNGLFT